MKLYIIELPLKSAPKAAVEAEEDAED